MNEKKLLSLPSKAVVLYMLFTVFLLIFGPIKWKIPSYPKLLFFLTLYVGAFAFGYSYQRRKRMGILSQQKLACLCNPTNSHFGFLKTLPFKYVRLIFCVSCAFSIVRGLIVIKHLASVVNISALLNFDIASAYFERLEAASWGTWYILALNLMYVLELFWYILGILYYKRMKLRYKILFFITAIVNIIYNFMAGEMIGWGVYIFRLIPILLISIYSIRYSARDKTVEQKRTRIQQKKILYIMIALIIVFLMLFSLMQESRSDYLGYDELSYDERGTITMFIAEEQPWLIFNSIIYPMDFYITQGYCAMAHALELPPKFTYGIGHSRDLARYLRNYFGVDLTADTYPQRLEDAYGWDNGMFWPSAFTWFASDWTFWGIPILMFLFGMFLCNVWFATLFENSIIAVTLFSWLWVGIFFISANNQLFQSFEVCMGTISLIVLYTFRKALPKLVL